MLALVVATLVPTVVMTTALALERLERCVLRMCLSTGRTSTAAVARSVGDGNAAAPVASRTTYDPLTSGDWLLVESV